MEIPPVIVDIYHGKFILFLSSIEFGFKWVVDTIIISNHYFPPHLEYDRPRILCATSNALFFLFRSYYYVTEVPLGIYYPE